MLPTYQAEIVKGKISLLEKTKLPDGAKVLVTIIPDNEQHFWTSASETSLKTIWDNKEDDVYEKLLSK